MFSKSDMSELRTRLRQIEPTYLRNINLIFLLLNVINVLLFQFSVWRNIHIPIIIPLYEVSLRKLGVSSEDASGFSRSVNAGLFLNVGLFAIRLVLELIFRDTKYFGGKFLIPCLGIAIVYTAIIFTVSFDDGHRCCEASLSIQMLVKGIFLSIFSYGVAVCLERAIAQLLARYK